MEKRDIITAMGWNYDDTESSARMVAEYCASKMYSEEDMINAFTQGFNARYKMLDGIESREEFMAKLKKK
jgi:hypothetical protein